MPRLSGSQQQLVLSGQPPPLVWGGHREHREEKCLEMLCLEEYICVDVWKMKIRIFNPIGNGIMDIYLRIGNCPYLYFLVHKKRLIEFYFIFVTT